MLKEKGFLIQYTMVSFTCSNKVKWQNYTNIFSCSWLWKSAVYVTFSFRHKQSAETLRVQLMSPQLGWKCRPIVQLFFENTFIRLQDTYNKLGRWNGLSRNLFLCEILEEGKLWKLCLYSFANVVMVEWSPPQRQQSWLVFQVDIHTMSCWKPKLGFSQKLYSNSPILQAFSWFETSKAVVNG